MTSASTENDPQAWPDGYPLRWRALAVLCSALSIVVIDNTILAVAIPAIERGLHTDESGLQWIGSAYGLVLAGLLLIAISWLFRNVTPSRVDRTFRRLQLVSSSMYSLGHGGNDAQKTIGIIWMLLIAANVPGAEDHVPGWVVIACYAMIGLIYLEQGQLDRSAESYVKALGAQSKTVEQEMNLYYDLGTVYEMKGATKDALYYFQKIARRDPGYRDVADRINALDPGAVQPKPTATARAVNDDDDFDRAFDDLFEGKQS